MQPVDDSLFFGLQYKDFIMTVAVILGPILAVQAQKFLEQFREKKKRRIEIFRTLMTTRFDLLHRNHVQALNMIDIDFYGWVVPIFNMKIQNRKEKAVTDAWKIYRNHLNKLHENSDANAWGVKRQDLFVDVLSTMAISLNYSFDRVQLEGDGYRPMAYNNLDNVQAEILSGLADVLKGDKSIPMMLTNISPVATASNIEPEPEKHTVKKPYENENKSN
ncbi:TPA: DUF6680 family protein [Yersinia enterocolitica]|uniref:DUF6680 family protein n=1 Tax=Yersinia enterocolitica TaxID=630 RepID=UPI0030D26DCC|nr:hypothetical protein [Yersinia enterocolitica]HDL7718715.1 hypothetical protein [Yersinia enterocolitica]